MGLFDKLLKKGQKNVEVEKNVVEEISGNNLFAKFLEKFPPSSNLEKPTNEVIERCRKEKMPEELIKFWNEYGFGNYGNGIIKVINPEDYDYSLSNWLGKEDSSKIPIFMTGFGDIFYYRNLSNDEFPDEYDISILDIHYRNVDVCTWDLDEFLNEFLMDKEIQETVLRENLFEKAMKKVGKINEEEIYFFVPALVLGGAEEIKYIDKGHAGIHQEILLQLGK